MTYRTGAASAVVGMALACGLGASPASAESAPTGAVPRAVTVARTTTIPNCTVFVDAAARGRADGTVRAPYSTITAAIAAAPEGAIVCVAEGTYVERLAPGTKGFTLAGGFQSGSDFKTRDSARYVSKARGNGGSFIRIVDPGPSGDQLTAIDGFDISGYSQAIVRDFYVSQRFDITNNHIHDNVCADPDQKLAGAGFALLNVTGKIHGNVFRDNACARGGAGFVSDAANKNSVSIERNLIDRNSGTEPEGSHGGALYLFANTITVTGNLFTRNSVTQWGAGLYIGAYTPGNQPTTARLSWNIYRGNRAGNGGGGFFCDDGATCISDHEIYDSNCGGNILLDGGPEGSAPTIARFAHITNVGARAVGCEEPGEGVRIDKNAGAADTYSFVNALFWNNAPGRDFVVTCDVGCGVLKISVAHSMVQTKYVKQGNHEIAFGPGIMAPQDPLFADPAKGDFHLKSAAGRWTVTGIVKDSASSPALGQGDPRGAASANPARAGSRSELGAYGNSGEASYTR